MLGRASKSLAQHDPQALVVPKLLSKAHGRDLKQRNDIYTTLGISENPRQPKTQNVEATPPGAMTKPHCCTVPKSTSTAITMHPDIADHTTDAGHWVSAAPPAVA